MNYNRFIDHTLLKADTTIIQLKKLCEESIKYDFYSVCVNPVNVKIAKNFLEGSHIKVCSVVGFPLGANSIFVKEVECKEAIKNGADEIDLVINIGKIKEFDFDYLANEVTRIRKICKKKALKVIIETCYLTQKEIERICLLLVECKVDFIKTSTGFGPSGATVEDVKLIKQIIGNKAFVKASGGIKDLQTFKTYLDLGVKRIGTSNGIKILNELGECNEKA